MAKQTFTTGQVLTAAQMTSLQQTAMSGGAASAKTASYTLVAADAGSAISMSNASATTITVNTALFAAGDTVHITNLGAGVCTITAGTATVNSSASLALAQYESGFLDFTSTSAAIFVKGAGAAAATGATYVGAAAFRNANLSVAKNTNVLLTLPSEQYDTDGFHSTVTNTGRFTIPSGKAGKYLLTCFVSYDSAITEQAWLMLYVNGVATTAAVSGLANGRFQEFGGSANTDAIAGSVSYTYSVGDYAEVYVFHNGTNTPINIDAARVTFDYLGA
jgi:hypothetical protein